MVLRLFRSWYFVKNNQSGGEEEGARPGHEVGTEEDYERGKGKSRGVLLRRLVVSICLCATLVPGVSCCHFLWKKVAKELAQSQTHGSGRAVLWYMRFSL